MPEWAISKYMPVAASVQEVNLIHKHNWPIIQYEFIITLTYFSGRIETGMKIIANISKVETDSGDRPTDDVRILKARIIED